MRLCHICYRNYCDIDNSRLICNECEKVFKEQYPEDTEERKNVDIYLDAFAEKWKEDYLQNKEATANSN